MGRAGDSFLADGAQQTLRQLLCAFDYRYQCLGELLRHNDARSHTDVFATKADYELLGKWQSVRTRLQHAVEQVSPGAKTSLPAFEHKMRTFPTSQVPVLEPIVAMSNSGNARCRSFVG